MSKNNRGCNNAYNWKPKPPKFRISKSKGHAYAQVTDAEGDWYSVGPATPENLAIAFEIVRKGTSQATQTTIEDLGKKHGILDSEDAMKEFQEYIKNEDKIRYVNAWADPETEVQEPKTLEQKAWEVERRAFHNRIERERRKNSRAMRKLRKNLKIPEPKKEDEREGKKECHTN